MNTTHQDEQLYEQHYAAAIVENVYDCPQSSTVHYLRSMEASAREFCEMYDTAAAAHTSHAMRYDAERTARHYGAVADAYADALRVLDIAADSAERIAARRTAESIAR